MSSFASDMKNLVCVLVFALSLFACDQRETKLQRFLLQGNDMAAKQNFQEAKKYYREAIRLDSCFADAWNNLGTVYYKEKHFLDALESYSEALSCRPDFYDVLLNRSNTFYELNQLPAALNDLNKYDQHMADTSVSFFSRALILTKLKEYDSAITLFKKALSLDNNNVEIVINLGTVYYYKRDFTNARRLLDSAMVLKPDEGNIYNTIALLEMEQGNYTAALNMINKALLKLSDDPYYLNNRGYLYLLMNDLPNAIADIDKSISTDPYNAWAYRNKGIYSLKRKDYASAIRLLERAKSGDPQVDKLYFYLGEAYSNAGDKVKGCENYSVAVERQEMSAIEFKSRCR
jgi:tetratricopeptide (TPR) repeat protein